jgi:RND family efflux transporter MFP subunit
VLAPYDGRVRSEQVDVGQFVNRGAPVAKVYAVDFAEVRLPIPDEELAFLDLPLTAGGESLDVPVPVILRARFGGQQNEWRGEVVRTEGELDPRTRMVNVIARVDAPYAQTGRPPLAVGLFVEAEISGSQVDDVVVLPRSALRGAARVIVVDGEDRLQFRDVDLLRLSRDRAYVRGGLEPGERVCVSPLESAIEGMLVRLSDDEPAVALGGDS